MTYSVRIDPIDRDIAVMFPADFSPQGMSAAIATEAQSALTDAAAVNRAATGVEPKWVQTVDGAVGAPFTAVKPDGLIIIDFDLQGGLVDWVWNLVVQASPIRSGAFLRSLLLFADGEMLRAPDPTRTAEEWIITTNAPYARKIEGMSGQRPPLSEQAPHGVFQAVAAMAARRYGNVAAIKFVARSVEGGALAAWSAKTALQKTRNGRHVALNGHRRADWLSRQPAIVIRFL